MKHTNQYNGVYLSTISGCMYQVQGRTVTVRQFPEKDKLFINSSVSFCDARRCIDKGWWIKSNPE